MTAQRGGIPRRKTKVIRIGSISIGGDELIAIQSMCATRTTDIAATLAQIRLLESVGADLIRIAVDSKKDVEALKVIRQETSSNLVVDLQESFRLAEDIAPMVQKMRYNPGHLHHHWKEVSVSEKVRLIVDAAGANNCALRIGVNFGSIDPNMRIEGQSSMDAAICSALEHCDIVESLGFSNYCVSLKSSDPISVVEINRRFASQRPEVPLHLGVTEAGMLPEGEKKTRFAFEQLLPLGIGDTIRVSLTLPDDQKHQEVLIGRKIVDDIARGDYSATPYTLSYLSEIGRLPHGLNVISCPSCSRVENKAFVQLAQEVKSALSDYNDCNLTVAVMGCRVNGPGETDDADIGLWCAPNHVNLKRGKELVGQFGYDEVIGKMMSEIKYILADEKRSKTIASQ